MDARLVWDVWRRILRSDQLVRLVTRSGYDLGGEAGDFSPPERTVLADYASTPVPTDTNIGMYRRGLVRNALGALNLVPLTRRLLYMSGLDVEDVAADFARLTGFPDYGPNFWRAAGCFIDYLVGLPEFRMPLRQDVLSLDAATVALARRLGESPVDVSPESVAGVFSRAIPRAENDSVRFVASSAAVLVSSHYDLTAWIENPDDFDANAELEHSNSYWLIFFSGPDAAPEYAELSERAARVLNVLSVPRTAAEILVDLDGLGASTVNALIDSLVGLGAVFAEEVHPSLDAKKESSYKEGLDPALAATPLTESRDNGLAAAR